MSESHRHTGGHHDAYIDPHRNRGTGARGERRSRAERSNKCDEAHRRDERPGCHWFYVGGGPSHRKYVKSVTRTGPVALLNLDEAALVIKGPGGTRHEKVGATLKLQAKGLYKITMVKQAADDNHLKLTIK